ncbi:MAG: hypothetical protein KGQ59_11730, partial [Bdellovibrionales bacterium]|nr:hypothetical protein [Bdellovibrionales bacterium]
VDNAGTSRWIYLLDYNKGVLRFDYETGELRVWVPKRAFAGIELPGPVGMALDECTSGSRKDCGAVSEPLAISLDFNNLKTDSKGLPLKDAWGQPLRPQLLILQRNLISRVVLEKGADGKPVHRLETIAGGCRASGSCQRLSSSVQNVDSKSLPADFAFGTTSVCGEGWIGSRNLFEATPSGAIFFSAQNEGRNTSTNTSRRIGVLVPRSAPSANGSQFVVRWVGDRSAVAGQWLSFSGAGLVSGCEAANDGSCPYCNSNCDPGGVTRNFSDTLIDGKFSILDPGLHWAQVDRKPQTSQEYRLLWPLYYENSDRRSFGYSITTDTGLGRRARSSKMALWRGPQEGGRSFWGNRFFTARTGELHAVTQWGVMRLDSLASLNANPGRPQWIPRLGAVTKTSSGAFRLSIPGDYFDPAAAPPWEPADCSPGAQASDCRPLINSAYVDDQNTLYFLDRGQLKVVENDVVQTIIGESQSSRGRVKSGLTSRFLGLERVNVVAKTAPMNSGKSQESLLLGDRASGLIQAAQLDGVNVVQRYAGSGIVSRDVSGSQMGWSDHQVWRSVSSPQEVSLLNSLTGESWDGDKTPLIHKKSVDQISFGRPLENGYVVDQSTGDLFFMNSMRWAPYSTLMRLVAPRTVVGESTQSPPFLMRLLGNAAGDNAPAREVTANDGCDSSGGTEPFKYTSRLDGKERTQKCVVASTYSGLQLFGIQPATSDSPASLILSSFSRVSAGVADWSNDEARKGLQSDQFTNAEITRLTLRSKCELRRLVVGPSSAGGT